MKLRFHRNFEKKHKKLGAKQREKLYERLRLFVADEFNPALNNHPLKGKYQGYRSINITGDWRAVYKREDSTALFIDVDTHSNLYG